MSYLTKDCHGNPMAPKKDKVDNFISIGAPRVPQKDQMDHWRHFLVSRGPKVDNGSRD